MKHLKQFSLLVLLVLISISTIGQTVKLRNTRGGSRSQVGSYNGAYNGAKPIKYKAPKLKTYKNSYGERVLSPTKTAVKCQHL